MPGPLHTVPRANAATRWHASTALRTSLAAIVLLVAGTSAAVAQTITLSAGNDTFSVTPEGNGPYQVSIAPTGGATVAQVRAVPVQILVCQQSVPGSTVCPALPAGTEQTPLFGTYGAPQPQGRTAVAVDATVTSPAGSTFDVHDVYAVGSLPDTVTLTRTVAVTKAVSPDLGFNSAFTIGFAAPPPFRSLSFFAPGVWYDHNDQAPAIAFGKFGGHGGTTSDSYWRETRTGAPMLAMQDETNGLTLALAHTGSVPQVGLDSERSPAWQVGPGIRYGSLGVSKLPQTTIGFIYPADEGEGSYVPGSQPNGWVRRSNPVTLGFQHSYTLTISLDQYALGGVPSFTAAMSGTWRKFFPAFAPQPQTEPIDRIFADGLALFAAQSGNYDGAQGFPFEIATVENSAASGTGPHVAFQMGYTGMQIPGAFEMLRNGVLNGDSTSLTEGTRQLDFWADNAVQPANAPGLPDTIYNVEPGQTGWFNNNNSETPKPSGCHPIFFRSLTDGMLGMINAAVFMREHSVAQPNWERFTQNFGDWLFRTQNADGSFFREYNPDGTVFTASAECSGYGIGTNRLSTTDAIPFLVALFKATGDSRYEVVAERAGRFAIRAIYGPAVYVGGISSTSPDGKPLIDREAGMQAIKAALALYDITGETLWLDAAREAADYTETWLYLQNSVLTDPSAALAVAGTRAYSLVGLAAPNSTADIGMSIESYDFYRLHLLGDDATNHYLQVALLLENNSKLTTELGAGSTQSYGYAAPGLLGEADDVSYLSYVQPNANVYWLPWETQAEIEPIQRMQDTFGVSTIEAAQQQTASQLAAENARIYPASPFAGWGR